MDGYEGYDCVHALCNAHPLREQPSQAWAVDLAALLRQAPYWKNSKLTPTCEARTHRRYDALVKAGWRNQPFSLADFRKRPAQKLLLRLAERKDDALRFISAPLFSSTTTWPSATCG